MALTSLPIRSVDSAISAARPCAVRDAAIHATAAPEAGTGGLLEPIQPHLVDAGGNEWLADAPGFGHAQILERLEQLIFGICRVERRHRVVGGRALDRLSLHRHELARLLALDPGLDEQPDRRGEHVECLGQIGGGPSRGGRRVVELVREPGGHRPERGQPLAVLFAGGSACRYGPHRSHDAAVNGALRQHNGCEVLGGDHAQPDIGDRPHLSREAGLGHRRDRAHPGRRHLPGDRFQPPRLEHEALDDSLEQQEHSGRGISGLGHESVGRQVLDDRDLLPARELLVVQTVEQVDRAQVVERRSLGLAHALARYS